MAENWKQMVLSGKREGPSTPPPTWRLELPSQPNGDGENKNPVQEFLNLPISTVSARKLCATLWEIQPHQHTPLARMNKPGTTLRRRKDTVAEPSSNTLSDKAVSASSVRRHVAASLVQHHRSVESNCNVSPASHSSSVEVAPYQSAVTSTSSLDLKGMVGESNYGLTTSTELIKLLNRIWSLEEKHASNISVVKALKMELYHSHAQIKELLREEQMNRKQMENLMKHMTVDTLVRKSKERDRIKTAVQSIKEELEDERMLRKRSESLHRKLARELSEIKSSLSSCLRNLERERKARILLENLCDEFAKGIRDYELEVHSLRRNPEKGQVKENSSLDRLILHISEAWLDERMQLKLAESGSDLVDRISIVDKLGFDIETFLHVKQSVDLQEYGYSSPKELKEIYPCQHSLDSFPLQESGSAPQNTAQEDSIDTDLFDPTNSKFRLQRNNATEVHQERKCSQNSVMNQTLSKEINEERNISCDGNASCFVERKASEMGEDSKTLLNEEAKQGPKGIGSSDKVYPESICREDSCCVLPAVKANASPAKLWKLKLSASDFDSSESPTKLPKGVKENTLMAKLLEARLEGQRTRSRAGKSTS